MLPFVTKSDLTKASSKANISHEAANGFLKMLLEEHSQDGARAQQKRLWTEWLKTHYSVEEQLSKSFSVGAAATRPGTPPNELAEAAAAGPAG